MALNPQSINNLPNYPITQLPLTALVVYPLDPTADATEDLVGNGSDLRSHFADIDAVVALTADDDDFVAGRHVEAGHVGHQHVHVHRADDRRAASADDCGAAAGEPQVEAVGISGGDDRDRRR